MGDGKDPAAEGKSRVTRVVVDAWKSVLGMEDAQPDDEFFSLGGHSLSALELAGRVEEELRITFPLDVVFSDGRLQAIIDECTRLEPGTKEDAG